MREGVVLLFLVVASCLLMPSEGKGGLQIGVKERPEKCDLRTKKGDRLSMHYTVRRHIQVYVIVTPAFNPPTLECRPLLHTDMPSDTKPNLYHLTHHKFTQCHGIESYFIMT